MFNVLRDVPAVTKIAQVAVRDFSEREAALAASSGRVVLFDDLSLAAAGFRGETWDAQCLRIVETLPQEVYVSFDIDGLSYENCPHTGTPVAGGLGFNQAVWLLDTLVRSGRRIVGFDVVEVTPAREERIDAITGARVLWTPGANANGVKELVIAGMLLAARDVVGGIQWVQEFEGDGDIAKIAEKKKKAFAGTELSGKKLGVIGLGAIGVLVANVATHLGMEVYGYDPYLSVDAAWRLSRNIHHAKTVDELYKDCDYITIHVPAMDSTKGMIDKNAIGLMKDGVVILNYARNVLVDEEAVVDALVSGHVKNYVTDFPTPIVAGVKGAIITPHLGASTEESEDNCAKMAVAEVRNYLENGNIQHSVHAKLLD